MSSFQTRNPIQQCAGSLADLCESLDRKLSIAIYVLGGACYAAGLLLLIAYLRGAL
jgi:hypothetical protein